METEFLVEATAALAQITRIKVVAKLAEHGEEGLPAGELAKLLATPANTMSTHLAILARAGVVTAERRGRGVTYRLVPDTLRRIAAQLAEIVAATGKNPSRDRAAS